MVKEAYNKFIEKIKIAEFLAEVVHSEEIIDNLKVIYEWEYKYHKVKNMSQINDDRKANILNAIEKKITPILDDVIDKSIDTFKNWVDLHDSENPEVRAKARLEYFFEEGFSFKDMLDIIKSEYKETSVFYSVPEDSDYLRLMYESSKDIFINTIFPAVKEEEILFASDDLDYYREQGDEGAIRGVEEYVSEMESYDSEAWMSVLEDKYSYDEELYIGFLTNILDDVELDAIITNLYAYELPERLWEINSSNFENYEGTFDNIVEIYNQLVNADSFTEKFKVLNIALNTVHNSGSMLEYFNMKGYWIDEDSLKSLSDSDTTEWDRELAQGL